MYQFATNENSWNLLKKALKWVVETHDVQNPATKVNMAPLYTVLNMVIPQCPFFSKIKFAKKFLCMLPLDRDSRWENDVKMLIEDGKGMSNDELFEFKPTTMEYGEGC